MFFDAPGTLEHPLRLMLSRVAGRDALHISWLPNPLNEGNILGYKISWDQPSLLVQSAVVSVAPSITEYIIENVDLSLEYSVAVWAYTMQGDGQLAKASWIPKCKILSLHYIINPLVC